MRKNKRGQVTIFIIIAILIIAAILLFFLLKKGSGGIKSPLITDETDIDSFLEICLEERVYDTIDNLLKSGGEPKSPLNISFKFGEEPYRDIAYLCYTSLNDKTPCVVQQPSIINQMEIELESELTEDLEDCLYDLESSFENQGYSVTRNNEEEIAFDLIEDKLIVEINSTFVLTKAEETIIQKDFELEFPTKLFNLGKVAGDIVNSETKYSNFDFAGYMKNNPNFKIKIHWSSDLSKVYSIEHYETKEELRFAIRGGVVPID